MIFHDGMDGRLAPYADADNLRRAEAFRAATLVSDPAADAVRPGLAVVILTLNRADLMLPLVADLGRTAAAFAEKGLWFEALVGDTGSTDPDLLALYDQPPPYLKVVRNLVYNFSRCNNRVARDSVADTVIFLNNDVILTANPACLLEMYEHLAARPQIGVAGLSMRFGDGRIQHAGIDFFRDGPARGLCFHPHAHTPPKFSPGDWWAAPGATGAALMIRRDLYFRVGCFDEDYKEECQDVALCLAARRLGYGCHILDCGDIKHLENATREKGSECWADRRRMLRKYGAFIAADIL